MITEQDLLEAIAECQGQRNPSSQTCIKLAAYYTILNNLHQTSDTFASHGGYSYSPPNTENAVEYTSSTDFAKIINGKSAVKIWAVMDELMTTLMVINPKLYNDVMRKLTEQKSSRS